GCASFAFVSAEAHWDGAGWTAVALPQDGSGANFLDAVSVVSPTEAWAVGRFGEENAAGEATSRSLVLSWDGAAWSIVPSDSPDPYNNEVLGVDALPG